MPARELFLNGLRLGRNILNMGCTNLMLGNARYKTKYEDTDMLILVHYLVLYS